MRRPEPSFSVKITRMDRKALFFDIDGTLIDDKTKRIPESAVKAIKAARAEGHLVFINTGRARCILDDIEGRIPVDGYLCGCGTYIEIDGKVVLHHILSAKRRAELQKAVPAHNLDGVLEGRGGCTFQNHESRMPSIEHLKKAFEKRPARRITDWNREVVDFDKFCVVADEASDIQGFLKALEPDVTAIDRGQGLYECVPTGFDKAAAMKFILDYYGISWENSYAFGDSTNDLAMIKFACNSVIMGHHAKELEPHASFVTKNVDEDGIAHAFEILQII